MANPDHQFQEPATNQPWQARMARVSRAMIWTVIGLLLLGAALSSRTAWAQSVICYEGFSSIPVAPSEIFLRNDGTPVTYSLELCEPSTDPVTVDINPLTSDLVEVSPDPLTLGESGSTIPKSVHVTVDDSQPGEDPFSVIISHSVSSDDGRYDFGEVNAPWVTAYYSPPVAVNDIGIGLQDSSISVNAAANDLDRLAQGLTYSRTSDVEDGQVTLSPAGGAIYTPTAGFFGADSFTYAITDAVGSSDDARVQLVVLPESAENGQAHRGNPNQGGSSEFSSNTGATVGIQYPPGLLGDDFPPGTEMVLVFTDKEEPEGNTGNGPGGAGFTGVIFEFTGYVGDEELDSEDLSQPITVTVTLPPGFERNGAALFVAVWDGSAWSTEGINITEVIQTETAGEGNVPAAATQAVELTFSTTVLGEFAIFSQNLLYIPAIERAGAAAGAAAPR